MSDNATQEQTLLTVGLYQVDENGDPGDLLTRVRLPAVPRRGDEILKGDPADTFVVRGRAVYADGKKEIAIAVDRV